MKRVSAGDGGPRGRRCCFRRASRFRRGRSRSPRRSTTARFPGVIHIHTNRSDGRSTPDEIAAAAARAGLKFIVFTDHGDAHARARSAGVSRRACCASTASRSARPAATTSRSTCRRRRIRSAARRATSSRTCAGSAGSASRRIRIRRSRELRWREWAAPFDGIELLNPDTSWRQRIAHGDRGAVRRGRRRCSRALLDYPFRPAESIAGLLQPTGVLDTVGGRGHAAGASSRSPAPTRTRSSRSGGRAIPATAGSRCRFPATSRRSACCRSTSGPTVRSPGDAAADAAAIVLRAIRAGHLYTAVDGVATPPVVRVHRDQRVAGRHAKATSSASADR